MHEEQSKRVLVIDDEQTLRETLAQKLKAEGYAVLEADNGTKGLQLASEYQPDLILLDIRMPETSGFEMLKTLREKGGWGASVPVVFLTNIEMSDEEEKNDIESLKPAGYIVKSDVDLEDVAEQVRAVFNR